jgi:Cu(I)/Ag(I) efflux system protein CusF
MKSIKKLSTVALFIFISTLPVGALAQTTKTNSTPNDTAVTSVPDNMTYGEVRKINKETQKLTLRHGKIENLKMPPMTMVFKVNDKNMLDKVQVGDKVKFKAIKVNGKLTVTDINVYSK